MPVIRKHYRGRTTTRPTASNWAEAAKAQAFLQECRTRARKELQRRDRALTKLVKVLEVKLPKLAMETWMRHD
jgi:hypothetical protein